MKKIYLSATPLLMYLTELPFIGLLVLSIIYNSTTEGTLKLYPLIAASIFAIIFDFLYLFRLIIISTDEIRIVGLFSSKDKAIINKGKTLILTMRSRGRMRVTLFGNDGTRPALDWTSGDDYTPADINLFRERAEGGVLAAKGILRYFDVPASDTDKLLSENVIIEYKDITVTTEKKEHETDIRIKFNKTI